jgi:hypothetical protein
VNPHQFDANLYPDLYLDRHQNGNSDANPQPVLWIRIHIRIRIGSGFNGVPGLISFFEVLDVLL